MITDSKYSAMTLVTVEKETKTISEWAKDGRASVSAAAIEARLNGGATGYNAVLAPPHLCWSWESHDRDTEARKGIKSQMMCEVCGAIMGFVGDKLCCMDIACNSKSRAVDAFRIGESVEEVKRLFPESVTGIARPGKPRETLVVPETRRD